MQGQLSIPHPVGSNYSQDVDIDYTEEQEDVEAQFDDTACASYWAKVNGQVRGCAWMFQF